MIGRKAEKETIREYKKTGKFLTIVNGDMYIADDKNYRKVSEKELYDISHYCLHEVEDNRFYPEVIERMEVYPIVTFSNKARKIMEKNYPNILSKKQKRESSKVFVDKYKMKLSVYLAKNKNLSFKEIHEKVLIDTMNQQRGGYLNKIFNLIEEKDIDKVMTLQEKHLYSMIDWLDIIPLGKRIRLKVKKGKIIFKVIEYNKEKEIKKKKFFNNNISKEIADNNFKNRKEK